MIRGLSYGRRTTLVWVGFVLFLLVGYKWSFSESFVLASELREKTQKINWLKEKQRDLPALKKQMDEFSQVYSGGDSIAVRDRLTAHISDFADHNNLLVTNIPANIHYTSENLKVQTNTFTIRGGFTDLVTLLRSLEVNFRYISKIMSARFYVEREDQGKRKNLYLTVVTQTFQKQN